PTPSQGRLAGHELSSENAFQRKGFTMWHSRSITHARLSGLVMSLALLVAAAPLAVRSAGPVRDTTSLMVVPADAALYSSSLRMRQQYDALMNSRAMNRLLQLPAVAMARGMFPVMMQQSAGPEWRTFQELLKQPENQQLIELVTDAG